MSNNFIETLNNYKIELKEKEQLFEKIEKENIINKTNLEHEMKKEQELIDEIKSLGFDPDKLTAAIEVETAKVEKLLETLNKLSTLDVSSEGSISEIKTFVDSTENFGDSF